MQRPIGACRRREEEERVDMTILFIFFGQTGTWERSRTFFVYNTKHRLNFVPGETSMCFNSRLPRFASELRVSHTHTLRVSDSLPPLPLPQTGGSSYPLAAPFQSPSRILSLLLSLHLAPFLLIFSLPSPGEVQLTLNVQSGL